MSIGSFDLGCKRQCYFKRDVKPSYGRIRNTMFSTPSDGRSASDSVDEADDVRKGSGLSESGDKGVDGG